jgi:hypothetical protein
MKTFSIAVAGFIDQTPEEVAIKQAAISKAAQTLVSELQAAGVRVQTGSVLFNGRPGAHTPTEGLDLLLPPAPTEPEAPPEAPTETPAPVEPAPEAPATESTDANPPQA